MSREISIVRRSWFKKRVVRYDRWDEMSQNDFTALCAVLKRSYYDTSSRFQIAEFLDDIKSSPKVVMKTLKVGHKMLCGPLSQMSLVKFGELSTADSYYDLYTTTGNEEYLYLFVACLYRPKRSGLYDDPREPFDENTVSHRAKLIKKKASRDSLFAISINYAANMEWMTSLFKFLFPPSEDSPAKGSKGRGYLKIARSMANGKTDEDLQQVYCSNARGVFDTLNEIIREESKSK